MTKCQFSLSFFRNSPNPYLISLFKKYLQLFINFYNLYMAIQIVYKSIYKNYEFFITYNSFWYCAYIVIPENHPFYCEYCSDLNIPCHGGLSYSGFHPLVNKFCIGWDYGHIGDYKLIPDWLNESNCHKWTIEEIILECKKFINLL